LRLAFVQKRVADFRIPIFARIAEREDIALTLISGSSFTSGSLPFETRTIRPLHVSVGSRQFMFQPGALKEARNHEVLVVEGSLRFLTSVALVLARKLHGVPVVWWTSMHDPRTEGVSFPDGARGRILRRVLENAQAILTYSEEASSVLRRENSTWRVYTAPNVLDTALLDQAEGQWRARPLRVAAFRAKHGLKDRPSILFVGRLVAAKRVSDLISAFRLVRVMRPELDPVLTIVGDGPERGPLQEIVSVHGIADHVLFAGEVREIDAVCPWFLAAKVLVLPGSGGLAIYQALSHGVPVICGRADGTEIGMIRDGVNGFTIEVGDIESLAHRIARILDASTIEWTRLSDESRSVAHGPYHVNRMVDGIWAAVDGVSQSRDRGSALKDSLGSRFSPRRSR